MAEEGRKRYDPVYAYTSTSSKMNKSLAVPLIYRASVPKVMEQSYLVLIGWHHDRAVASALEFMSLRCGKLAVFGQLYSPAFSKFTLFASVSSHCVYNTAR